MKNINKQRKMGGAFSSLPAHASKKKTGRIEAKLALFDLIEAALG